MACGNTGNFRKALLLSACRLTAIFLLTVYWSEHPWLLGIVLMTTFFVYLVLRTDSDRHSCIHPMLVAPLPLASLVELGTVGLRNRPVVVRSSPSSVELMDSPHMSDGFPRMIIEDKTETTSVFSETSFVIPASVFRVPGTAGGVLRKMMAAQLPEAIVCTLIAFASLSSWTEELYWNTGIVLFGNVTDFDVGPEVFNEWFHASPNGIVRRRCPCCDSSYENVFYRRVRKDRDTFEPYDYMTTHWSEYGNEFRKDFDIYSSHTAAMEHKDPWNFCEFPEDSTCVGFPYHCGRTGPLEGQWDAPCPHREQPNPRETEYCLSVGLPLSFAVERRLDFGSLLGQAEPLKAQTGFPSTLRAHSDGVLLLPLGVIFLVIGIVLCVSILTLVIAIKDMVVSVWIKTAFVEEHEKLVGCFYFVEISSWWPIVWVIYTRQDVNVFCKFIMSNIVVIALLILVGFSYGPRSGAIRRMWQLPGQAVLAVVLAPALAGSNFLFFDKSLTFRPLNKLYYILRFLQWVHLLVVDSDAGRNPVTIFGLFATLVLALMVWVVVPRARRAQERRTASEFSERAAAIDGQPDFVKDDSFNLLNMSFLSGIRKTGGSLLSSSPSKISSIGGCPTLTSLSRRDEIVEVLRAVGDTFEALLLASNADSQRVRSAILDVAVQPLRAAGPATLEHVLPLLLPQLLLSLRWRLVDDGSSCPLTKWVIKTVIDLRDSSLVSMVYWHLLALSADRTDAKACVYRTIRLGFLEDLDRRNPAADEVVDEQFCKRALRDLASQRRLYIQMRQLSRAAGNIHGSHKKKTTMLRSAMDSPQYFKRYRGRATLSRFLSNSIDLPDEASPTSAASTPMTPTLDRQMSPLTASRGRRCFSSCCVSQQKRPAEDPLREEWELESILTNVEDKHMDLRDPKGGSIPVEPGLSVGGLDAQRSFVAQSAVAPVVFCFKLAAKARKSVASQTTSIASPPPNIRHFALKTGDDLRQDALVLQMFRLMETTWIEHGLKNMELHPYKVMPASPTEGIVAFVPNAVKVSSILLSHDGDVAKFIARHNEDPSAGFERLCGSTAGYCVATYVLGIGDRHLDNLMITEQGHFFHIDFGYVLGEDPKPCAPLVRAPREVIDAIRAVGRYEQFQNLVAEAFLLIRRTARLWISLLSLTASAGGNGVGLLQRDPGQALHVVRERLRLDLDDNRARAEINSLVEESASSLVPVMYDKIHQAGLFWN